MKFKIRVKELPGRSSRGYLDVMRGQRDSWCEKRGHTVDSL